MELSDARHHYILGHIALREICADDPVSFFCLMNAPERDEFLDGVWRQIRDNCDVDGKAPFDITDVDFKYCTVQDYPTVLITMPEPEGMTEAYFVAMILKIDIDADEFPENPEFQYFTLEKGSEMDGTDRTVMCEWTADGKHMNYGDGPPPDIDFFVEEVIGRIR